MAVYALVLWTVVAATGGNTFYDWRPLASFRGQEMCKIAAKELNLTEKNYRCIKLENYSGK
jgi:hypothetical protein